MATNKVTGFRYPNELARIVADHILKKITPNNYFLGGSYIRELPTIGDVDLCLLDDRPDLLQLRMSDLPGTWKRRGQTSSLDYEIPREVILRYELLGIALPPTIQVDFWVTDKPMNWGALCMFCAGNQQLNIIQRSNASKAGYLLGFSLRQKMGVGVDKKGKPITLYSPDIDCPTEQDVYKILGWPWLPYRSRSLLKK